MLPVFSEFISFLNNKLNKKVGVADASCWIDNGFIKAFTSDGKLHKLYKYKVYDDLSISLEKHKEYIEADFETWDQTIQRLSPELDEKINESLDVIRDTIEKYNTSDLWALTSTGKDSTVVIDLVKKIKPDINIMFNNTSLDSADTYKIVKSHPEWIVTNPKEGFYVWSKRINFVPTRFTRACCRIFKEEASINWFEEHNIDNLMMFMGVRNDESNTRSGRQFIEHNPKWKNPNWLSCLPIRKWTDLDVWLYMLRENLEINPKYRKGYQRVGCSIACAYYSKSTWVLDEYWYNSAYKRWHEYLEDSFIKARRWVRTNCTLAEYHNCWNGGLIREEPTEEVIQEMMHYTGLERDTVLKYFNKVCECGDPVKNPEALGMNYKFFGLDAEQVYCKDCLKKKLNMKEADWRTNINTFKEQGCKLF